MDKKVKLILYAVGGLIVLIVVMRVLRTGKRRARQADRSVKKQAKKDVKQSGINLRSLEQFNPDFQQGKAFARITDNGADLYAEQLRKAVRGIGTNEEVIYNIFNKLKNKVNISEISARYYLKFKRSLLVDLLKDLNNKEQKILFDIIKTLPDVS